MTDKTMAALPAYFCCAIHDLRCASMPDLFRAPYRSRFAPRLYSTASDKEGFFISLINISNLTFAFDGSYDNIFEDVSFHLDTDWKTGFVGRNGRGKTTFLKLLAGEYKYSGHITAAVDFKYFPFPIVNKSAQTLDVAQACAPEADDWEICREMNLLGLNAELLYRPFITLSGGEQTKVMLASLFLAQDSFLLIDEPTNHLDMQGREKLGKYLNSKKGFILVSHDRAFLDSCTDHTISLNKQNIELHRGNFSSWYENKQRQDNLEKHKNEKLKKEIRRLNESAAQASRWSDKTEKSKFGKGSSGLKPDRGFVGKKAAKLMKRSTNLSKRRAAAAEEKASLLKNTETTGDLKITQEQYKSGLLLALENVNIFYSGKTAAGGVNLKITEGSRIALCGANGSGKSSVLKLICGENLSYTGRMIKGGDLKISYLPQDIPDINCTLRELAQSNNIDESLLKSILTNLGFTRGQLGKNIRDFSMGQKKKTLIAKCLCERSNLLVWDEPLNYIDIFSRMQIEELILKFKPAMIYTEHDASFCQNTATEIIRL